MNARLASISAMLVAAVLLAGAAQAADLTVVVRDDKGRPVADAVVILEAPSPVRPRAGKFTINQKAMQFVPSVLVVPVGSTIEFTNLDPFRHHVYSFSPPKKFELKLFGQGEVHPVKFDKPGLVAIGCNIHDQMQAFVQVVDTPFAAKSGANGTVVLHDVPAGNFKVEIYHPRLRAPGNQLVLTANTAHNLTLPVTVKLRTPAPMQHSY